MKITLKGTWFVARTEGKLKVYHNCHGRGEATPLPGVVVKYLIDDKSFYQCSLPGCQRRMPGDAVKEAYRIGATFLQGGKI